MLEPSVKRKIQERYQQLNSDGKLLSRPQLEQFYKTFRDRFGPDKLANLDGEALLNTMHLHGNKDSLVYWLEFKNDDEFPAIFGGIAGGSSYKFGLFRRRETGIWTAGTPQRPIELTIEQAIDKARQHRDQLVAGAAQLEKLASNADDAAYRSLQESMRQATPDINFLGWVHKYFSLLYPDKLDDFHQTAYQDFHLIKM